MHYNFLLLLFSFEMSICFYFLFFLRKSDILDIQLQKLIYRTGKPRRLTKLSSKGI